MLGYNLTDELPCHVSQWDAQWNTDDLPALVTDLIPHDTPVQTRHRRQNGSSYDAAINVVRITHGGQAYLFCTMRDVTAQHQAEVTLRKHEEQYRSLSERVGFRASQSHIPKKPIWLCDALFTVLSDKLLERYSFPSPWGRFVPATAFPAWKQAHAQAEADYLTLRDEIVADHPRILGLLREQYTVAARRAYRVIHQMAGVLDAERLGDQEGFVSATWARILSLIHI